MEHLILININDLSPISNAIGQCRGLHHTYYLIYKGQAVTGRCRGWGRGRL